MDSESPYWKIHQIGPVQNLSAFPFLQGFWVIVCVESHCYAYIKPQEMFQRSGQVNLATFLLANMNLTKLCHIFNQCYLVFKNNQIFFLSICIALVTCLSRRTWMQLINLYPDLVSATASTAPSVAASLKQALLQYGDLLQPPPPTQKPAPAPSAS